ncbi:MAG: beta-glucosidase, partial [Crocinitomicaceae bacterium]|nr:beta-glucosidase [Crocinitomicaceae bacterium]
MKNILFYFLLVILFSSCSSSSSKSSNGGTPLSVNPIIPVSQLTDTEAMDQVQKDAIHYFWEYAETNSKLARERYHTDNPGFEANKIATGGSGFGLMSLIVGIERGFIPRTEAVSRMTIAMDFLAKADRFHGAWAHWIDGNTGRAMSFSNKDDGGDIVETAYLCQGLLVVREFF